MRIKIFGLVLVVFVVCSCSMTTTRGNVTKGALILLDENVEIASMDALGVSQRLSLVVLFNEQAEEMFHDIRICQCDLASRMCGLYEWVETNVHPADPELLDLINEAWEEDFPGNEMVFEEETYYPEPAGPYKVEAIYYPPNLAN